MQALRGDVIVYRADGRIPGNRYDGGDDYVIRRCATGPGTGNTPRENPSRVLAPASPLTGQTGEPHSMLSYIIL